jgi:hypothetical protein
MSAIRVDVFGDLRGLCIERSQIGSSIDFVRNGWRVSLALPSDDRSWSSEIQDDRYLHLWPNDSVGKLPPPVALAIKASLRRDLDEAIPERSTRAHEVLTGGVDLARELLKEFREWARVRGGQYWLGYQSEQIRLIGHSKLIDESTNTVLAQTTHGRVVYSVGNGGGLDSTAMCEISSFLGAAPQGDFELGDAFLADARFLAHTGDYRSALVMAAVACEAKIKEVCRADSPESCLPLLDLILSSYREIPIAAAMLFDQVAKSMLGTSLRESDRKTFKSLRELFELRNQLVHRGVAPSSLKTRQCIETAVAVFDWLRLIRSQQK